ncbi:MAG: SpoIIIAH-like family protein [Clostridiales bacterium]|nr:SpoIIIAH-like family protein [Clostridiales bacterium]HBM80158.1 hypothetical protein [Clostridiaceae bacterium]
MMELRKRTVIIVTLVLLIAAAAYLSSKYGRAIKVNKDDTGKTSDAASDILTNSNQAASSLFVDVKIAKENERTASKQDLKSIIDSSNTSKEAKATAEKRLETLVNNSEKEMISESLIKSKGYEDALVLIGDNNVNVTVKGKNVSGDKVNEIKNIVVRQSGYPASKISVQVKE